MGTNKAVIIFKNSIEEKMVDVEVPLSITVAELIIGLNEAYGLGLNVKDINNCYLKSENPISLLKGNKKLEEFGIHNGSLIICDKRDRNEG